MLRAEAGHTAEVRRALTLCAVILMAAVPSVAAAQTPNLGEVVQATTDAVKAPLQPPPAAPTPAAAMPTAPATPAPTVAEVARPATEAAKPVAEAVRPATEAVSE